VKRSKWMVIARNEYHLMTSGFPSMRRALPLLVVGAALFFLLVVTPWFIRLIENDFLVLIVSQAAVATVAILLLTFFFYSMVIPIINTLRDERASELEIFLSAPVRPEDVLLGKFMGKFMVYGAVAFIISGFLAAVFTLAGISLVQLLLITFLVFILLLSGLWLGTVVAAILRTRLSKTAKGTDLGKAMAMILPLPLLGLMYVFISGAILNALNNPSTADLVESMLALFPSTWVADLIVTFAQHPGQLLPEGGWIIPAVVGVVLFAIGSFYSGNRAVARSYTLEPTAFGSSRARREGVALKAIRRITGSGDFSVILVTMFKDWGRRLENISKVAYIFGLVLLMVIFLTSPEDPFAMVIMLQFMMGFMCAIVVGEVTIRGKEVLFIYRKAPGGEKRLVWARLLHGWFLVTPTALLLTLLFLAFTPGKPLIDLVLYPIFMAISGMALTAFVLGLFLIKPAFTEKSGEFVLNMMATMFISFILLILTMMLFDYSGLLFFYLPMAWMISGTVLYLGLRNLRRIE